MERAFRAECAPSNRHALEVAHGVMLPPMQPGYAHTVANCAFSSMSENFTRFSIVAVCGQDMAERSAYGI